MTNKTTNTPYARGRGESHDSTLSRYLQLAVLVVAGGAIYPLVYLRQNFEVTILEAFGIGIGELSQCYAMLGVMFMVTYLPSGWLADRVQPRWLMAFSLAATGMLGFWFSTYPSFTELQIIFVGWGITTGLTFWSALIKAVALLARNNEQGRFFGILDGGRGLVEAMLATIAIAWFSYALSSREQSNAEGLQEVIYFYALFAVILSPIILLTLREAELKAERTAHDSVATELMKIARIPEIWLAAACILAGYQLFWATYSFSAYLQQTYGMTAVAVGTITVAKLWMRPIGAVAAGFAGDLLHREGVLAGLLVAAALALFSITLLPTGAAAWLVLTVVLAVGFLTYAVRGVYWATLEACNVSAKTKGLAIGVISLIGYSPDVYLPLINGALLERFPGRTGYTLYFSGLALLGLAGAIAAWQLKSRAERRLEPALSATST